MRLSFVNWLIIAAYFGLPLAVELAPFRSRGGRYVIPVLLEVPPGALSFERKGDRQRMRLDVLGVVRGGPEKVISRLGGSFGVDLTAKQYQSIMGDQVFYRQDLELAPGEYTLELVVRDRPSGKVAAKRERLVLPEAGAEFAASGVALSRRAEPAHGPAAGPDVLREGDAQIRPTPRREVKLYVVSDRTTPTAGVLEVTLLDFEGRVLSGRSVPVEVRPLASEVYLSVRRDELLGGRDPRRVFLNCELRAGGAVLAANRLFFEPFKRLSLPRAEIVFEVGREGRVSLRSGGLARGVHLSAGPLGGEFSDNFFDLLPGREVTVEFRARRPLRAEELRRHLKVRSLADAFGG